MSTDTKPEEPLEEDTLLSHLVELRSRLLRIFITVSVFFAVCFPFAKDILRVVSLPIVAVVKGGEMVALNPVHAFFAPIKLTFVVALALAMPVVLYQVWSFVAPGLYKKEKRFAIPMFASSILLFYAGVAFAYFVLFPLVFKFLVAFAGDVMNIIPDVSQYVDLVVTISFVFGIAFEVPVATVLIVWAGLVTPDKLASVRPYVFLMAFVVGMFLTPPDMISQTLLAVPIYLLYELGILMSRILIAKKKEAEEAEDTAPADD